jgi:carboxyl-terminal processing protease
MNSRNTTSFWSRLTIVPAVVGLVSTTFIIGYASNDIWPNRAQIARRAAYEISDGDTQGIKPLMFDGVESEAATSDPVADYKAAIVLIRQKYYNAKLDTRKLTYEAIRGMLAGLRDPFTSVMEPVEWERMEAETKGDYEGIGAYLDEQGHEVKVLEPIENSPAERAGIHSNDVVTSVDGRSVLGKPIDDVIKLIKGRPGTKVRIGVLRGKKPLEFVIQRSRVVPPVVKYEIADKEARIGYIALKQFNERSMEQLTRAFEDLKRQGAKAILFDLRDNPGGLLEVAVQVTSVFVPRDEVPELKNAAVYIQEGSGQETRKTLKSEYYLMNHLPLAVLVDEGSASASEIVSGAIKDYGVGTLIGERTYGKGKVQTLFPLDDNSALRLTTANYYPPRRWDLNFKHDEDGNRIAHTGGVLPDIEVKQPKEKWKGFKDRANDAQWKRGIAFLRTKLGVVAKAPPAAKKN